MKSRSGFSCRPIAAPEGMKLRPEKAGASPLVPKKLNFYCTSCLEGGLKAPEFATFPAMENADNQRFTGIYLVGNSIKNNNTYNFKDFKFYPKISKNEDVFSKNFQLFPGFFQLFRMDFQFIVAFKRFLDDRPQTTDDGRIVCKKAGKNGLEILWSVDRRLSSSKCCI